MRVRRTLTLNSHAIRNMFDSKGYSFRFKTLEKYSKLHLHVNDLSNTKH